MVNLLAIEAWFRRSRAGQTARLDAVGDHGTQNVGGSTEPTSVQPAIVEANDNLNTTTSLAALKTGPPEVDELNAAASQGAHHITTELQLGPLAFVATSPSIFALSRIGSPVSAAGSSNLDLIHSRSHSLDTGWTSPRDSLAAASVLSRTVSLRHTPSSLPRAVQSVLEDSQAVFIDNGNVEGIAEAASHFIAETAAAETFYIYDLGEVARLHATWLAAMPRVTPHYAVKCNPEPVLLAMLNALGVGFDCASIAELEAAAALGVAQSRIIFANPCKRPADFRYAAAHGVDTTTFDCPSELHKIAQLHPAFKCVLRIRCDDETAKINLGTKYGADMSEVPELLDLAKALALQVVGVSFHVGSGCQNVAVYSDAISKAREVFDLAEARGFPPLELLDVGGGFTAPSDEETSQLFSQTAAIINSSLDRCFPAGSGVRIISEPGRFFAETSATRFSNIMGHRQVSLHAGAASALVNDYWISDSYHGSFRIQVAVDGLEPSFLVLRSPCLPPVLAPALSSSLTPSFLPSSPLAAAPTGSPPSTLPGNPSCSLPGPGAPAAGASPFGAFQTLWTSRIMGISGKDGDRIHETAQLPLLRVGDWLMFPYAGAYSICSASNSSCGAFLRPPRLFVFSAEADKGWGDILPQESTTLEIPPTIPENVEVLHSASLEDLDTLRQPSGASPFQSIDDEIAAAAAAAAAGFAAYRSLSVGSDCSQSLQRRLSRAPSAKSRG